MNGAKRDPLLRQVKRLLRSRLRKVLPWLRQPPPPGYAGLRRWRRVSPIRPNYGWDTGGFCIDRYYIEGFLDRERQHIRGRVLEVGNANYTRRFGGDRVTHSDVLHVAQGHPGTTIVGDLVTGRGLENRQYDCVILTQVLMCIYDLEAAVSTIYRILAPSGIVLITEPGLSQIARYDMDQWGDCWRFTSYSASKLIATQFPLDHVMVETRGNVLAAIGLLHGLLATEFTSEELDHHDPDYQVSVLIKAIKPADPERYL